MRPPSGERPQLGVGRTGKVERFGSGRLKTWLIWASALSVILPNSAAAEPKSIKVEYLKRNISPENIGPLDTLFCRNIDHVVHINVYVEWPNKETQQETTDIND